MNRFIFTNLLAILSLLGYSQDKWNLHNVSMHFGGGSIAKKADAIGFVFSWDAAVRKKGHILGAEYETATNMRITGNRYAVDQINLLYGRSLLKHDKAFVLEGYIGSGFYRQSRKAIGSGDIWSSETAVGLKLKLLAQYPVYKQLYVSVASNVTFNFSNTYLSALAGGSYRF